MHSAVCTEALGFRLLGMLISRSILMVAGPVDELCILLLPSVYIESAFSLSRSFLILISGVADFLMYNQIRYRCQFRKGE